MWFYCLYDSVGSLLCGFTAYMIVLAVCCGNHFLRTSHTELLFEFYIHDIVWAAIPAVIEPGRKDIMLSIYTVIAV